VQRNNGIKYVLGHLEVPPDEVECLELYSSLFGQDLRMANTRLRYDKNRGIIGALMQKECHNKYQHNLSMWDH
jgi:hypothetical protein